MVLLRSSFDPIAINFAAWHQECLSELKYRPALIAIRWRAPVVSHRDTSGRSLLQLLKHTICYFGPTPLYSSILPRAEIHWRHQFNYIFYSLHSHRP